MEKYCSLLMIQASFDIDKLMTTKTLKFILNSTIICLLRSVCIFSTRVLGQGSPLEHAIGVLLNNQNKLALDCTYAKIILMEKLYVKW